MWIGGLGTTTFSRHPDLEPAPDVAAPFGAYRLKAGVNAISLDGYLPYADAALASYEKFRELRKAGVIAADVRFQVSLPTPHAAIGSIFGTRNNDSPRLPDRAPSMRASTRCTMFSDRSCSPAEMKILVPVSL